MTPLAPALERRHTLLLLLAVLSLGYFSNAGSWNQNARLNTVYAYVEAGPDQFSFHFDRYMPKPEYNIGTGDWSYYGGHYYSNKAPGASLLAIPVYALLYPLQRMSGTPADNPFLEFANAYLLNLAVSVLPIAWALVAFALLLERLGTAERRAATLSCTLGFGTLLFPYATQLWAHGTAAAFLVIGLERLFRPSNAAAFWAACYLGLAVCTDYLAAIPACVLALLALYRNPKGFPFFLLGTLPPIAILASYHWLCFGSAFSMPTDYTNPEFLDQERILGLFGGLSGEALWHLSFGTMRGIFFTMPVLMLSLYGFWCWFRSRRERGLLLASCVTVVAVFLVNASFNGWHAGASVGARYQIVALPFWVLALRYLGPRTHLLFWPLLAVSLCNMLATAAVSPIAPDVGNPPLPQPSPLIEWVYRHFFSAELAQFVHPMRLQHFHPQLFEFIQSASWNWGMLLGLSGLWSLVPLLLISSGLGYLLFFKELSGSRSDT